jgi:hypothetical protein
MSKPVPMALDSGISYPVRLLRDHGLDTCQSCEGGDGHAYHEPTIELYAGSDDSEGFRALAVLQTHGIDVARIAIVWECKNGLPYQRVWSIELRRAYPEFARTATPTSR